MTLRCLLPSHISTPRRLIGGRCRKWAVSTQQTTDKRRCASCTIRGSQFTHGEPRLQQCCNRDSHRACAHAQCINGGVAHDHELRPKQPTDQDSVEAVARQRYCITHAAADSEIPLLTASSDQASTAAPADDEVAMFSAVRRPFAWKRKLRVSNGLTQSRGAASKISETPRTFSHRHDSGFLSNKFSTPFCIMDPPPRPRVLSSWLLRRATNVSDSSCSHFLENRLDLFWSEDWPVLWSMVRAECDVAPISRGPHKSAAEHKQSGVRKVATFAR